MGIDDLLKERNDLRDAIEQKRKKNEKNLLYIKGFLAKIPEYVEFCEKNDIRCREWHDFDGKTYMLQCDKNEFSIHEEYITQRSYLGTCYVKYKDKKMEHCIIGTNPTLETITEKGGAEKEYAKWFVRNIEIITSLLEKDMERCVQKQIDEAKELLNS